MRLLSVPVRLFLAAAILCLVVPAATAASTGKVTLVSVGPTCGGGLVPVGDGLCTHGGDTLPGPLQLSALRSQALAASPADGPCPSDGVSGPRIRVYYGYPADTTPNASGYLATIREAVAIADRSMDAQTPAKGGQHFRMYCKDDRRVTVTSISLVPIGADGFYEFDDVIDSFIHRAAKGLGGSDIEIDRFTYVVFVDNVICCYGPAGQGTIYWDDRPDPDVNYNNRIASGPRFAMIERSGDAVTEAYRFLHEVGHTLGAVQLFAPHSTGYGHCYTNVDVMCSFDGGSYFTQGGDMVDVCDQPPPGEFTFDCEGRDYYDLNPAKGSYLAKHWNTAYSAWLTRPR
jgi:hypothetical protein